MGADKRQWWGKAAVPRSAAAPFLWHLARLEAHKAPYLGASSPKHGPTGARQKGGGRKGQHRRALSSIGSPPGTIGVQGGKGNQASSLLVSQ